MKKQQKYKHLTVRNNHALKASVFCAKSLNLTKNTSLYVLSLLIVGVLSSPVGVNADSSTSTVSGTVHSSISLSSSGSIDIISAPTNNSVTSSGYDIVKVSTNNNNGYTLNLSTNGSSNKLTNGSDFINPINGTKTSPKSLATNTWGYRVNNLGSFGPSTTIENNVPGSGSYSWAEVPISNNNSGIIKSTSGTSISDTTKVWYGINTDASLSSGKYTNTIVYTATVNP